MEGDLDRVADGNEDWVALLRTFLRPVRERARGRRKEAAASGAARRADRRDLPELRDVRWSSSTGASASSSRAAGYPECKTTKPIVKETGAACPRCGGAIVERRSKKGRIFYGCANYPNCDFISWDAVVPERCPVCGSHVLAKTRRRQRAAAMRGRRAHDVTGARAGRSLLVERRVKRLTVIGGGLAGCEAAWQAARCGVEVDLFEMRPHPQRPGAQDRARLPSSSAATRCAAPRSKTPSACSKKNCRGSDSLIVTLGARNGGARRRSAGGRSRSAFRRWSKSRIAAQPQITLHRRRSARHSARPSGDRRLRAASERGVPGESRSPLVGRAAALLRCRVADRRRRLDRRDRPMYRKSRYDKGATGERRLSQHSARSRAVRAASSRICGLSSAIRRRMFEETRYFEGCLPIEEMADRGDDVLRFGPLKPVGLRDPRTGKTPVCRRPAAQRERRRHRLQSRRISDATDVAGAARSLREAARARARRVAAPGRHASQHVHRCTSPARRAPCGCAARQALYFAGQITGAEGYVEAAACGMMTGIHAARAMLGSPPIEFPRETAFGAVVAHLQNRATPDFQPSNVTWALCGRSDDGPNGHGPDGRLGKRARRRLLAERALAAIDTIAAETLLAARRVLTLVMKSLDDDSRGSPRRKARDCRRRSSHARQNDRQARRA